MNESIIKVWIVEKHLRRKWCNVEKLPLAPHTVFLSLRSNRHPANKLRSLLKKQAVKYTESLRVIGKEDYYVINY